HGLAIADNRLDITDELEGTYQHAVDRFHWHPDVVLQGDLARKVQNVTFRVGDREVRWASNGPAARLEKGSYYPEFGLILPDVILVAAFQKGPVSTSISWQ
ncbi:MAG: hypothetical protein GH142_00085, partial [Dehalococcoidia bacterium]|nr:hypothetical protein [Dehalococcoidia bacterium]